MCCPTCFHKFAIRTNPKEGDYDYTEGVRKKVKEYDPSSVGGVELMGEEERSRRRNDPMARLEQEREDKRRAEEKRDVVERMEELSDKLHRDDFGANRALRRRLRGEKKRDKEERKKRRGRGVFISNLPSLSHEEEELVDQVEFITKLDRRKNVRKQSIFSNPKKAEEKPNNKKKKRRKKKRRKKRRKSSRLSKEKTVITKKESHHHPLNSILDYESQSSSD